jgi:hypothetical protein
MTSPQRNPNYRLLIATVWAERPQRRARLLQLTGKSVTFLPPQDDDDGSETDTLSNALHHRDGENFEDYSYKHKEKPYIYIPHNKYTTASQDSTLSCDWEYDAKYLHSR